MRYTSVLLVLMATLMPAKPARSFCGSGSANREDPELGGEQPVDRGGRHVRAQADGLHGGRRIAAFEEEVPGPFDHGPAGQAGARLAGSASSRAAAIDGRTHRDDTITLKMRVLLSVEALRR